MTKLYEDHADLYDLAFDWDVTEEVRWLRDRLGADCRTVLEPGCGSGRILEAFARAGLEAVGLDRSAAMVAAAMRRFEAAGVTATAIVADITDFQLGRQFDGAVCPINTLAHLSPEDLARHLSRMSEHLRSGARYIVQLDLHDRAALAHVTQPSQWENTRGGVTLRTTWATEKPALDDARVRQRSRIEILSGKRAGEVIEETHVMTAWTPEKWAALVGASPFVVTATYEGDRDDRPRVAPGVSGRLLWHELTRDHTHLDARRTLCGSAT